MKRSHVYLDPMTPDGKPGEVKEIEYDGAGSQQFLAPVSYAENDDLGKLRAQVHVARAKLHHAKSRGVGVDEAQKALEAASAAASTAHYTQQKAREQQRTGADTGAADPFSRQSTDTRQFMPVRDYSAEREGDLESPSEELSEEQLEAAIVKAVDALEQAQSNGATPTEMLRLEAALKILRDQLENPSAPPAQTTAAPPRKKHITQPTPDQGPASQAAAPAAAAPAAPKKKPTKAETKAGWDQHLSDLDEQLKARALVAVYPPRPETTAKPSRHAQNVCCVGKYLCPECQRKKAAAAA